MGDISKEWPTHLPKKKQNNIKKDYEQPQTLTAKVDSLYMTSASFHLELTVPMFQFVSSFRPWAKSGAEVSDAWLRWFRSCHR
jgi:hypothetical protein